MKFRELFRLEIEHPFFPSGLAHHLVIVPEKDTLKRIQGLKYLLKESAGKLLIYGSVDEAGLLKKLPEAAFSFQVFPRSSDFFPVTDLGGMKEEEVFLFSNEVLAQGESVLNRSAVEGTETLKGFSQVGQITIHPTDVLVQSTGPLAYKAAFPAKSEKWKYYFISDPHTLNLQIVDTTQKLQFDTVDLAAGNLDPIASALKIRFPEANLFQFESTTLIPATGVALKNLQLHRDGTLLIKHLANPEIKDSGHKIMNIQKLISKQ